MNICIAATSQQQGELIAKGISEPDKISWVANTEELLLADADALIDCTFHNEHLPNTNKPFLFHSPINTLTDICATGKTARFCAWNTFLERSIWEIATTNKNDNTWVNVLMTVLGYKYTIIQDVPGLIAPRIIATIINEATIALQAGISTKEEINLAMKLGTNYPHGPFEWAALIGADNINNLLKRLSLEKEFYQPIEEVNL